MGGAADIGAGRRSTARCGWLDHGRV